MQIYTVYPDEKTTDIVYNIINGITNFYSGNDCLKKLNQIKQEPVR